MPFRFDHIDARVASLAAVESFCTLLIDALGVTERRYARVDLREWAYVDVAASYNAVEFVASEAPGRSFFGIIEEAGVPPSRTRIAFAAESREAVLRIAALLPAIGARTLERSDDVEGQAFDAIFFEVPLGNRLEVVYCG